MPRLLFLPLAFSAILAARPYMTEPSLSPDRSEIAFVSGGDIWTVPASGGTARLLVSHAATESRPLFSPDGTHLAFVSTRTGNGDIYLLTLAGGNLKRLTFSDSLDQLDAWSRDGQYLYFHSSAQDIAGMNDIFRISAAGGTPMPVSADRYANEYFSAPAPNGEDLALTARGIVSNQWWRNGHSHIDESEIYIRHADSSYERLSQGQSKDLWPMWGAGGKQLFFVSDRSGAENLWQRPLNGPAHQLTKFNDGRLLWPSISYDGRAIVFERDLRIWKCDTANGQAAALDIKLLGTPAGPATTHLALTDFRDLALSPDGKKIAFIAHGEVFAASSKDGGTAARITQTSATESKPEWASDNHRLAYVSDRDGVEHIFLYDFRSSTETQLTKGKQPDVDLQWSHDGKLLAFFRNGKELHILDIAAGTDRVAATGHFSRPPSQGAGDFAFSSDDRYLAFTNIDSRYFRNVEIVATSGGDPRKVSFLANESTGNLCWSPDGKYLLAGTSQRTENTRVARIDLIPRTPRFREDQFHDLFKEDAPKPPTRVQPPPDEPKKPGERIEIEFAGIRERLSLLPVGIDVSSQSISPDGKTLLLTARAAGQLNLYTYSLDELSKEPPVSKQLTSTSANKSDAQWSPDGKEIFYLEAGHVNVITVENRQSKPVAVTAEMDVAFPEEKLEVFRQAWSYLNENFYDPAFHGKDWAGLRDHYQPMIESAQTPDEVRRLISLMIGELNSSHSGIAAPAATQPSTGRLGLRFDRKQYESDGRLCVTEVLQLSPAAIAGIHPTNCLLAIDGHSIDNKTNVDELLQYKIDRKVTLTVKSDTGQRDLPVRPVNTVTEKRLLYRHWVDHNREYVSRISHGRLGYVHLFDMNSSSLEQLFIDLDAENHSKEGVVVDVRNNNGGFVNAYALDVLTRKGYLNMTERGLDASAPARSILGQRSLEKPTVLVVNQHSLSDAEDFTEGYRTLKLGKVVGEPTAGWIIYTGGTSLIDGSVLRLPRIRITANDGTNMEGHPRPVDVLVLRPIGESYTEHDSQLDAAINTLLNR